MTALLGAAALLASMGALVAVTMAIENWSHIVQPLPPVDDDPVEEPTAVPSEEPAVEHRDVIVAAATRVAAPPPPPEPEPEREREREPEPTVVHPAGRPERAVVTTATTIRIRDEATADVLAAVLFAAYATSRRAGADCAAAWVTAAETPPTADPERFAPGVVLRSKPARVAELLAHRDGGSTWVTLQPSVDIAVGVARTPVKQPTLAGLVSWWEHAAALPCVLRPSEARRIAAAIGAVRPQVDETPWSGPVGQVLDVLRHSVDSREPVLVGLADPGEIQRVPEAPPTTAATARTGGDPVRVGPTPAATPTGRRSRRARAPRAGRAGRS